MTSICAYCGKQLGERCGRCNGPASRVVGIPPPLSGEWVLFCCPKCDDTFVKGEVFDGERWVRSGPSHGICEDCYPKALAEVEEMKASQAKGEAS